MITTINDVIRLVPFMVFIIIPFMELLLPVYLKFFPNALPSTFAQNLSDSRKEARMKKDYQVANILRDVLLDHASNLGKDTYMEFTSFMERIRSPDKEQPSNEEVLKFAGLFENDLTLNSLNRINLICLCELLDLPTLGPNMMLRGLIHSRINRLERDDRLILRDGIDTLTTNELQRACHDRGMAYFGLTDDRLRFQLKQWTDFSLNRKVPISLLLLSRAFFYAPRSLPVFDIEKQPIEAEVEKPADQEVETDFLKGVITSLPLDVEQATAWKLAELAGERVPNKEKLMAVRKEDKAIASERAEVDLEGKQPRQIPDVGEDESVTNQLAREILALAKKKNINLSTIEIDEYIEDSQEKKDAAVINEKPGHLKDVLARKLDRMLANVNRIHSELQNKRSNIQKGILASELEPWEKADTNVEPNNESTISRRRQSLVELDDVLDIIERLKPDNVTEPSELRGAVIANLVKGDNKIDVGELFKVLQYMSSEHIELTTETLEEVSETITGGKLDESDNKSTEYR
ncbi:hypothetical protein ACOME3_010090 [Neoechinorhynchus agilis]